MGTLWQDIKYGLRMLARNPGFTAVAVLILALGIGATTAIVSVVKTVLFDPLPVRHASDRYVQLVAVHKKQGWSSPGINPPALYEVQQQTDLFSRIAVYELDSLTLEKEEFPDPVSGLRVTPEFFRFWTLGPERGRVFGDDESTPGHDDVIVLSHSCWQKRFGGDPGVVGRAIQFRERLVTVVGIMPAYFSFPNAHYEYWRPFAGPQLRPASESIPQGSSEWLSNTGVLAELRPGVERSQVQAFLDVVSQRQAQMSPILGEMEIRCRGLQDLFIKPQLARTLWILMGAVAFVLAIASANVANLQLTRTERRQQELAVRTALGAGRSRVFRHLLTESLILSLLAGLASLVVVLVGLGVLERLLPPELPRLKPVVLDLGTFRTALLVALATGLLFGVAPAWRGLQTSLSETLKRGVATSTRGRRAGWFGRALIVGQIATVLVLLTGAGLMVRTVARLLWVDLGFDATNLICVYPGFDVNRLLPDDGQAAERLDAAFGQMAQGVAALPGVLGAGLELEGNSDFSVSTTAGGPTVGVQEFYIGVDQADPLRARRVPLRRGRWLERADAAATAPRVLVNETAAQRLWPGQDPVGRQLWVRVEAAETPFEVVGVVGDFRANRYDEAPKPVLFRVQADTPLFGPARHLVVRTAGHPAGLYRAIGHELKAAGAGDFLPLFVNVQETLYAGTAGQRTLMLYLSALASVALLLAATGLYSVLAYSVARRTREIGLRIALGAERRHVLGQVLGEGVRLLGVGLVLGTAAALALGRVLRAFLFDVAPHDPLTLACVALLLSLIALFACCLPARRAGKLDPMAALRCE